MAQLETGDIRFVGFLFDGVAAGSSCGDDFAFVCLADIPTGEVIFFTEDEYPGSAFNTCEGDLTWTNDTGDAIMAGTIVQITAHSESAPDCDPITTTHGSVVFSSPDPDNGCSWSLSSTDEEIYAYQGSIRNPTTWLTAMITDLTTNVLPAELAGFTIDLTSVDADADVGVYSGELCSDKADCISKLTDPANWSTQDSGVNDCCDGVSPDYPQDIPDPVLNVVNTREVIPVSIKESYPNPTRGVFESWTQKHTPICQCM